MFARTVDRAFHRFRQTGDSSALALVFDRTAPELLALGRHLASGEAAAEDLVQATFLTAIESQGGHDGARPVLPWLIGILANHAREARRRERRALDPTRLRAESLHDPVVEAEGRELGAELVGAIARLPEPYRPVLRLHLQHGLEPGEIAQTLEREGGTVRAQLHRGLERLRKLLPVSLAAPALARAPGRGLQSVRAAVLMRCGVETTAAAAAITGAIAMTLQKKILFTAAAVLLCGALGYAAFAGPSPTASNDAGGAGANVVAAATGREAGRERGEPVREEVAPVPVRAAEPVAASAASTGSLRVRVVSTKDRKPVMGIGVAALPKAEGENHSTVRDFVASDSKGEVTFAALPPGPYLIDVDRSGWAGVFAVVAGEAKEHEVELASGVRVEGTVVDASGAPVAEAVVTLHGSRIGAATVARSDRSGRFECDNVTPGVELQARKAGFAPSLAVAVQFASDGRSAVRLELGQGGCLLTGRVIDESGAPVPGALIAVHADVPPWTGDRGRPQVRAVFMATDAAGCFRTDEVAAAPTLITACVRSAVSIGSTSVTVGTSPVHAEVVLVRSAVLEGTVTDKGQPVADATVFVFTEEPGPKMGYLGNLLGFRTVELDAEGRFRLVGIVPGQIQASVTRGGSDVIAQRRMRVAAGETARFDVTGTAGVAFTLRVEPARAPGQIGRWLVVLRRIDVPQPDGGVSAQGTDANGCAQFKSLEQGRYELTVYGQPVAGDMIVVVRKELSVAGSETRVEVPAERLVLQPVRGRLVDATLAPAANVVVTLQALLGGADVIRVQRTTGGDGRFEFAGVPAGRYQMSVKVGDGPERALREVMVAGDREESLGDVRLPG